MSGSKKPDKFSCYATCIHLEAVLKEINELKYNTFLKHYLKLGATSVQYNCLLLSFQIPQLIESTF